MIGDRLVRPSRRFDPERIEPGPDVERSRRRVSRTFALLVVVLVLVLVLVVVAGVGFALREAEVRDPIRPRTIEPFSLKDAHGRTHEPADWRDAKAVVLFVIGTGCPVSREYAPEMRRLARRYGPEGVSFFGVHPDPAVTAEAAARHAEEHGLSFPVLLDPAQELSGDLGVRVTPEAAVLDSQGHVLYRGRIDDRIAPGGERRPAPRRRELEEAILAVIEADVPSTARTEASGSPLPKPRPIVAEDETITYNTHVAPIVWKHCAGCHRPGEVGPFSLLTYKDAAKRAEFLRDVTASRAMPPWRAVHGYGDFHDASRLGRRELAVLARWAANGAPEGDPDDRGEPPAFPDGWQLGSPDLVVTMPESFVIPADVVDSFRAFVLPIPLDRDTAVAAVEFRPGNRRVVHHARFYVDPTGECRRRDAADATPGFASLGEGDIFKPGLGAWVPGLIPRLPPPDVGKVIRKGSDCVLMIHYHGTGKRETDRSSLGWFFCKATPERRMTTLSLSTKRIDIPPGAKRHRLVLTAYVKADAHAVSVLPHGHSLMREIRLTATLPGGRVMPMLWIDDWDFNWQGQYHFARPVPLPEGTRLDLVASYDNSADNPSNPHHPPRRVRFGWLSTDEMLGCHVQVIADDAESQRVFERMFPLGL
jgi:peroxiredoxin